MPARPTAASAAAARSSHRPATLSLDGRNVGLLHEGDALVCTASATPARLATLRPRDFHRILKAKFGLADR